MRQIARFLPHRRMPSAARVGRARAKAADIRFIPGEDVLLLSIALPRMTPAQRRAAVAFAVEDQISAPLDEVHVVLGPQLAARSGSAEGRGAEGRWLVAVVARDHLDRTLSAAPVPPGVPILPDMLRLPQPETGHWAVLEEAGRILIRSDDGAGLVTCAENFGILHALADAPALVLHGGRLPDGFAPSAERPMIARPEAGTTGPDLRLAMPAAGRRVVPKSLRRFVWLLALGATGHLAVMAADTLALIGLAEARTTAVQQALARAGQPVTGDLDQALASFAARRSDQRPPGLVPFLATVFAAMAPQTGSVFVRELRYRSADGAVVLTLDAPDLGTLQSVETGLAGAGLRIASGAATSGDGRAEQQLTVQQVVQ